MRAWVLAREGAGRLEEVDRPRPDPGPNEVALRVRACGVCRTDLHIVDGELSTARLPLIPGHEIVGEVVAVGPDVADIGVGTRVGVPWLGWACGECRFCVSGRENLCVRARYTGFQIDGGFADFAVADGRYVLPIPERFDDVEAAPLLCAGLIGFRAYRMAGRARRLAIYGFGAAAHIITQVAVADGCEVYAFTRDGDVQGQAFAREIGASWAGASGTTPPRPFDAALLFAPVGDLVPEALRHSAPGATIVCAGIHMSEIPSFPYRILWEERAVRSVANLTRADGHDFLARAAEIPVRTRPVRYPLDAANRALDDLRDGRFQGAAVLVPPARAEEAALGR